MMNIFSDEIRRNPYPLYDRMRASSPLLRVPPPFDAWMIFDYEGVKCALSDHETFSSRVPAPKWFIFFDPPAHTKLRALISQAFTPRMVASLEPRIRKLSRQLLDQTIERGEMDLAEDFSVPLAMQVIAGMIGIPLADMIEQRRIAPQDDLLTRLIEAEVDDQRLSQPEILGFIVAGQETTTNLIDNAVLCLLENPDQFARLRAAPELLTTAIEEVLRYRSPLQWMMRTPRRDVEVHGQTIPAGGLVLAMMGSANRDSRQFPEADRFDIGRNPNPHVAFGHGIHFCLGAALSRMESKIALSDLLERFKNFELARDQPWEPRAALNVHGPTRLPIRFEVDRGAAPSTRCGL